MAHESKAYRNPYLVLLAFEMLHYEFVGLESRHRVSDTKIHDLIVARAEGIINASGLCDAEKEQERRQVAKDATNIRKALGDRDFNFSDQTLNRIIAQITILDNLRSWEEFETKYKIEIGAQRMIQLYNGLPFSEQPELIQKTVYSWVQERMLQLHKTYHLYGNAKEVILALHGYDFAVRTVPTTTAKDLFIFSRYYDSLGRGIPAKPIFDLFKMYPGVLSQYGSIERIHRLDKRTFFVCKTWDSFGGYMQVLPLTKSAYSTFKEGQLNLDDIDERHLSLIDGNPAGILITEIYSGTKECIAHFKNALPAILQAFSSEQSDIEVALITKDTASEALQDLLGLEEKMEVKSYDFLKNKVSASRYLAYVGTWSFIENNFTKMKAVKI